MEVFLFLSILALAVLVFLLHLRTRHLQRRLTALERQVGLVSAGAPAAPGAFQPIPGRPAPQPAAATPVEAPGPSASSVASAPVPVSPTPGAAASGSSPAPLASPTQTRPVPLRSPSPVWKKVERQLVENWTGIVGAIILTAGLGFLGLVAALALPPFFRFLMLIGVALGLSALSYFLERRSDWQKFSSWIRGVAGAVTLFACFGSAAVPGLKWVDDERGGLALIAAGVVVNLLFARLASRQVFASLHVLLSLVTLAILPQQVPVFVVAAVVALAGVILAYRSRWEHQALLVTASFALYQIYRYQMVGGSGASFSLAERSLGIGSTALVGAVALLMHYRSIYASERFSRPDVMPFVSHLVHWFSSMLGFILYSTGSKWNTPVLAAAALLCFVLARRGRSLGISWLYRTDTIVAQSIALFAGLTLTRWDVDPVFIAAILFVEGLAFVGGMQVAGDALLEIVSRVSVLVVGWGLFVTVLTQLDYDRVDAHYRYALVFLVLIPATILLDRRRSVAADADRVAAERDGGAPDAAGEGRGPERSAYQGTLQFLRGGTGFSPLEVMVGLFLIGFHTVLIRHVWLPAALAAIWVVLILFQRRAAVGDVARDANGARDGQVARVGQWGLLGAMLVSHIMLWVHVFVGEAASASAGVAILGLAPVFVASLAVSFWPVVRLPSPVLRLPGIALVAVHLLLCILRLGQPVTPLLAGTLWLMVSLGGLELGLWMDRRHAGDSVRSEAWQAAARLVVFAAFGFVLGFLVRHGVVELQTERYMGPVPVRALIEVWAVLVFLYWFHAAPSERASAQFFWRSVQPFFLEAAIILSIVALELEFTQKWMTLAFAILPFVLLLWERLRARRHPDVSRLRLYALVLYWVAVFHLAFLSSVSEMPAVHWLDRSWLLGGVGLLLVFGLVGWIYRGIALDGCVFPPPLRWLSAAGARLQLRRNLWIFDPAFVASALFLYWSFDRAVLTLLWVGLVFLVFSLSVLLREGHFRIMALIALAACLARLLFFDLSQSSLLMRAVVFVGVGVLMLGMNSLYNRFKDRFV